MASQRSLGTSGPRALGAVDVLIVTADADLADELSRLAVAAGTTAAWHTESLTAASEWRVAAMILIDLACLRQARELGLPRRSRVVLVSRRLDGPVWRDALQSGVHSVVSPDVDERWLVDAMSHASGETALGAMAAVIGARGGAGATSFATALALTAASEGLDACLIDLDPCGAGAGSALGAATLPSGWEDLASAEGRVPPQALRDVVPVIDGVRVVTWRTSHTGLPTAAAVAAVLDAAKRTSDIVVVDAPRWLGPLGPEASGPVLEALVRSDRVVLLCPADMRSVQGAERLLASEWLAGFTLDLVVRGPAPGGLTGADIAEALGLTLLEQMAAQSGLDRDLEDGTAPGHRRRGPLRACAKAVLGALARGVVAT